MSFFLITLQNDKREMGKEGFFGMITTFNLIFKSQKKIQQIYERILST